MSLLAEAAKPNASPLNVIGESSSRYVGGRLASHGAARFEKLRLLGDGVLYVSGFFSDHLTRRGLSPITCAGSAQRVWERCIHVAQASGPPQGSGHFH